MLDAGHRNLLVWNWADLLVMQEQAIGVLDLQVVRVLRAELNHAAFDGVVQN